MEVMAKAMKHLAMAIAASRRLGWIALALYIKRMGMGLPKTPGRVYFKTLLEYHRSMGNDYHFVETCMQWADDFRMAMYHGELIRRLDIIDSSRNSFLNNQLQKNNLLRRAQRALLELEDAWID